MGAIKTIRFKNGGYEYSISPSWSDSSKGANWNFNAESSKGSMQSVSGDLEAKEDDLQGAIDEAILTVAEANLLRVD